MNVILTLIWIIGATIASYFIGKNFFPDYVLACTIVGFLLSVIIRFLPKVGGEALEAFGDIVN